ncbi:glycosyltransferase family 4 protein [Paenisporosarcina sp. FSL H8-0542]|uniref:glycosyltransferase family 4 protein n=1 Tax=Paenisporosarcina sp. FSL H8-0542 TaxID=2921401 RepID=UPI003159BA58
MKKYLFISNSTKPTIDQQNSREKVKLSNVNLPSVEAAMNMDYEVFMGVNRTNAEDLECDYDIKFYNSSTYRSLIDFKSNYKALKNLMELLKREEIQVIHCNTPIGGMMGRLCGKLAKVPTVIYTAHGFHFYEGAPLFNRTILKWAEMWMARYTDAIITINQEDYQAAKKFKLRNKGTVYYVPGVGVNTKEYILEEIDKMPIRESLGLQPNDIVLISMGDLIARKDYSTSIKAIAKATNPNLHLLICGSGPELKNLEDLSKELEIERQIHFLGYRNDIKELLNIADIFLFTTYQEGLPRSLMEAMAAGLPCIASKIRGNTDLLKENRNGLLANPGDTEGFANAISSLATNDLVRKKMSENNLVDIKDFDIEKIKLEMQRIYRKELE